MARARNIKPSLFKNELLGEADPLLTILFAGLWTLADRDGRLEDRPRRIKAEIFPYREELDVNGYLTELASLGFILRYAVKNQAIIQVVNFAKHQSPHKTERPSELPEYVENSDSCRLTEPAPLSNGSATVKESLIPDSLNTDSLYVKPLSNGDGKAADFPPTNFVRPTLEDVTGAVRLAGYDFDPELFFQHYESTGWLINGKPMENWRARLTVWAKEHAKRQQSATVQRGGVQSSTTRHRTLAEDLGDKSWAGK